jgi:hypothetical protein
MISAIDGKDAGEPDRFRIKIWYEDVDGDEIIVYDNQVGSDETVDPTTELGGGSITVHKSKKK